MDNLGTCNDIVFNNTFWKQPKVQVIIQSGLLEYGRAAWSRIKHNKSLMKRTLTQPARPFRLSLDIKMSTFAIELGCKFTRLLIVLIWEEGR
jgi:hypothetical protein